jgi:transcription initiation factor TFIID subunit 6
VFPPETPLTPANPQLYYLKDEEIDLATFLKNAHTTPAKAIIGSEAGVRWKAHWLAIEGIQPLIKENPVTQLSTP